MNILSDQASECLCGGGLVNLSLPISLNSTVAPQTNAGAGVAVAALGATAGAGLGQLNVLSTIQRATSLAL